MPSPSYTSSSRRFAGGLLRSGVLWTAVAFVAIECALYRPLSHGYFSHALDEMVFDLRHKSYSPKVLVLGDSVGRQVAYVASGRDRSILNMASNGGIEMAGHYFLLRRFLERNQPPQLVVFLMRDPFSGNLRSIYTENYTQRCFGRPHEIASMAWRRRSLPFAITCLAYRSPSFRYRLQLQSKLSPIPGAQAVSGFREDQKSKRQEVLTHRPLLTRLVDRFFPRHDETVSISYMRDVLELAKSKGIRCIYIPTPLSQEKYEEKTTSTRHSRLAAGMQAFKDAFPDNFDYTLDILQLPPGDFSDTTHLTGGGYKPAADDFLAKLRRFTNP